MFEFLKQNLPAAGHLNILELGSGCGWLGMSLAEHLGDRATVVMSEQENGGGLDWLKHNLSLNPHIKNCKAIALDWVHVPEEVRNTHWNFIIGSELVYSPITCELLPRVMRSLCEPLTEIFYAHNCFRFEMIDIQLIENFRKLGFEVRPMLGSCLPTQLGSELFPDLNLEIYTLKLNE